MSIGFTFNLNSSRHSLLVEPFCLETRIIRAQEPDFAATKAWKAGAEWAILKVGPGNWILSVCVDVHVNTDVLVILYCCIDELMTFMRWCAEYWRVNACSIASRAKQQREILRSSIIHSAIRLKRPWRGVWFWFWFEVTFLQVRLEALYSDPVFAEHKRLFATSKFR